MECWGLDTASTTSDGQSHLSHSFSQLLQGLEEGGSQELAVDEEVEGPGPVQWEEGIDDLR